MSNQDPITIQSRSNQDPLTQDPLKIHPRFIQDSLKIHSRSTQDPLKIHSRSIQDPIKIQTRSNQEPIKVHSRSNQAPFTIRSRSNQDPITILRSNQAPTKPQLSVQVQMHVLLPRVVASRCEIHRSPRCLTPSGWTWLPAHDRMSRPPLSRALSTPLLERRNMLPRQRHRQAVPIMHASYIDITLEAQHAARTGPQAAPINHHHHWRLTENNHHLRQRHERLHLPLKAWPPRYSY